jgi:1-deoxy-D-xylulose-5-phosphate synthase
MSDKPNTPLLDEINFPEDVRKLEADQLKDLADEVRSDMIYNVSRTGGHLGCWSWCG